MNVNNELGRSIYRVRWEMDDNREPHSVTPEQSGTGLMGKTLTASI